jgi:hypothetical protein
MVQTLIVAGLTNRRRCSPAVRRPAEGKVEWLSSSKLKEKTIQFSGLKDEAHRQTGQRTVGCKPRIAGI